LSKRSLISSLQKLAGGFRVGHSTASEEKLTQNADSPADMSGSRRAALGALTFAIVAALIGLQPTSASAQERGEERAEEEKEHEKERGEEEIERGEREKKIEDAIEGKE